MGYAQNTSVSEDRSRQEIEQLLMKYGCDEFGYVTRRDEAIIGFAIRGVRIEMRVPLPDKDDEQYRLTPGRKKVRGDDAAFAAYRQDVRARWRSLCLIVKAKLVAIEDGVTTFETEFLPYMVTSDGQTIAQKLVPRVLRAMESGGPLLALSAPE